MSFLSKARKIDLFNLTVELGLNSTTDDKVSDLITLITKDENYNAEFSKDRLEVICAERQESEKLQKEEKEFELKKLELNLKAKEAGVSSVSLSVPKTQNLLKLMTRYDTSSDISVFLSLFERQISRIDVPKEDWVAHLLTLLPLEIVGIVAREPDPDANVYDHVKKLLLKRFKLSAEQFRQKFVTHKKECSASWRDFAFELKSFFVEWISGLDVKTFEDLKELLVTDQLKQKIPSDAREHFIDELPKIKNIDELVTKLDEYDTARRNFKKESSRNTYVFENTNKKALVKDSEKSTSIVRAQSNDFKPKNKYNNGVKIENKPKIKCFNCNLWGHRSSECVHKKDGPKCLRCSEFGHLAKFCGQADVNQILVTSINNGINKVENIVEIQGKQINALLDTGSELSMISYECYAKIGSPKLSFNNVSLTGIGSEDLSPLGFFHSEIYFDKCSIETDIYVLKKLCYEVIIGIDVINKLNISINEKGVEILGKRNSFHVSYAKVKLGNIHNEKSRSDDFCNEKKITSAFQLQTAPALQTEGRHLNQHAVSESNFLFCLANCVNWNEIDLSNVTNSKYKSEIIALIEAYTPRKTKTTDLKMNIVLSDDTPVFERARRFGFAEQKIIEDQIQTWLEEGIIQNSCSDFAAPVVLCKKKDNSHRLCVDYRKLNRKIVKDKFPLPLIEDVLDHLDKSKVFTSLDLKNGFFHVEIDEKSRKYTAFITHNGQYEFLKSPFGLCTSPNVFMRFVYNVFRELIHDNTVVVYLDDIIIPSENEEEGLDKLKRVLKVASDNGLELNFKKCQFLKRKIEFLGYVIENGTIQPSPTKTLAVEKYPIPKSIKQVQSFLGLTGYFRKFIPQYSLIAKPLSDLLRKGTEFKFGLEQLESFNKLKDVLSQKPVLHLFKQGSFLELHTDASSHGFGSVLLMKTDEGDLHPIQYMSKKTTSQQEKFSSYELEVLAIIESLKKFRNYLLGSHVKIVTDCAAFQKTLDKKELAPKVARWALFLEEFDYEIIHRSGNLMKHVDALSRNTVLLVTRSQDEMTTRITSAQNEDEHVTLIKSLVKNGEENGYFLKNDVLYKLENGRDLLVVPEALQNEIIRKVHKKGHFAAAKTAKVLEQEFFIPKARNKIEIVIANCLECILHNKKHGKGEGFLNPIPKENIPLSTYHIDFIGPLPSTNKRYQHIFTVVDAFTKFAWFYPVKSTSAQEAIEKLKLQQTVFGNPSRIITDRGSAFTAKEFETYCTEEGIEHVKITTGIPRGNGQIERIHRILIPVLSKLSHEDPTKWFKYVAEVQRIVNSTVTRSTKYTPFELMVGTKMKNKEDVRINEVLNEEYLNQLMRERDSMRNDAKENILKLQEENRRQFNKKRKKPNLYKLNDLVAIERTQFGTGMKLRPKFYGPYRITTVKSKDRYDVEKVGCHDGPNKTSTAADHMKPWSNDLH